MKKLLALALVLGLAGCAQLGQALQVGSLVTASYTNPVTPTMLYQVENGAIIIVAGLGAYKKACLQGVADVNCKANVRKIQVYTKQVRALLPSLRTFVKANDQINAVTVYNEIVSLIGQVKTTAASSGVPMGGV